MQRQNVGHHTPGDEHDRQGSNNTHQSQVGCDEPHEQIQRHRRGYGSQHRHRYVAGGIQYQSNYHGTQTCHRSGSNIHGSVSEHEDHADRNDHKHYHLSYQALQVVSGIDLALCQNCEQDEYQRQTAIADNIVSMLFYKFPCIHFSHLKSYIR